MFIHKYKFQNGGTPPFPSLTEAAVRARMQRDDHKLVIEKTGGRIPGKGNFTVIVGEHACPLHTGPKYPGKKTRVKLEPGEVVKAKKLKRIKWKSPKSKGQKEPETHTIEFYQLSDKRGWVHDFNPAPACRGVKLLTVIDHNKML